MNNLVIPFRANMGVQTTPPFVNTYSLDFNGVDDYVDCGNSAALKPNIITVSCWIKGSANSAFTRIISQDGPTGGADAYGFYVTTATNKIVFAIKTDVTGTVTSATSGVVLDNNWHHLVGTYDGSEVILYVDGLAVGSPSPGTSVLSYGSGNLTIGCFSEPTSLPSFLFNGNIDEVSIFNSIIPIGDLWDGSGAPTDLSLLSTPPLNWYRMGDNGSYKSPQWLLPSNENKDKASNYSFSFDGVDDFVDCGNPTDLQITGAFTLSVWTKLDSTVGVQSCVISKDNGTSERAFSFWGKIVDKPVFYIWNGGTSYNVGGTTNIADDTWHHVAVVYVPSTSIRIYVDGVLEGTNTTSIPASINNALYNFKIGEFANSLFEYKGLMDEVSVFDSDQSANIATLYNSGTPTTLPSGAVAHWRMSEDASFNGTDWNVPDQVGSNDGTSNAMTIEDRVGEAPNSDNNALSYNMDLVDRVTDVPT
jgi:hypothetical protein